LNIQADEANTTSDQDIGAIYRPDCTPQSHRERFMAERPRLLDDLAGMAGGAISALAGIRDEAEAAVRSRVDDTLRRLDVVRRDEFDAVAAMAASARKAQEVADARLAGLEARLEKLEASARPVGGGGPGMIV
jgi:BMFP domain-containing protein YqiC